MRISELSRETDVPVATVKYYLREGLLHPGEATARNQAQYDAGHVQRLQLIRLLVAVGGLDLATVKRVLHIIDEPDPDRLNLLRTAQTALQPQTPEAPPEASRASHWVRQRGWQVEPDHPELHNLERAWQACVDAGIDLPEARLDRYANAAELVAAADLDAVPEDPAQAVRYVILGTVLVDRVLVALRRLAQQDGALRRSQDRLD